MSTDFFRFPHTPHLAWLGEGKPRGDKVLDAREIADFLAGEVIVEEKVDGANVGLSFDPSGAVQVQNRGALLRPGSHPQFGPLWPWLATRIERLRDLLGARLMVFGEWCFAVHSIEYDSLPDWFLGVDVFDRDRREFWSTHRRNELLAAADIVPVPQVSKGHFSRKTLEAWLDGMTSQFGQGPPEGLYLRRENDSSLLARAKLVRREFVQEIGEHWSRKQLRPNRLRP